MKKIAVISQGFEGATLGLVNALSNKYIVDVVFMKGYKIDLLKLEAFNVKAIKGIFPQYNIDKDTLKGISYFEHLDRVGLYINKFPQRTNGFFAFFSFIYIRYYIECLKKYDFVIVIGQCDFLFQLTLMLKKKKRRHIHILHEIFIPNTDTLINGVKLMVNNKVNIVVHSNYIKNEIVKRLPNSLGLIEAIPFGPFWGYKDFNSDNGNILKIIGSAKYYILAYGFICDYKGYDNLWNIYEILKNKDAINFKIVVAGKGHNKYVEMMKCNSDFIVINRFLSNEEIATLIAHSLVVVCPYKKASQSGITMSSYPFGKQVIANRIGAFPEYIEDKKTGRIVDDNYEFADAIIEILNSCGNNNIDENYIINWKQIALKYDKYIN